MKKYDYHLIFVLLAFFGFIWIRDLSWISFAEDALPIIVSIPLFIWLGRPWRFTTETVSPKGRFLLLSVVAFTLGVVTDLTILFAVSWVILLWFWLSSRLTRDRLTSVKRLFILPFLAFPWLLQDGQIIGWWFRLSNAWVTAHSFTLMGFNVAHEGIQLFIQGLPIGVGAPCSGLNLLQSMFIAGAFLAYIQIGTKRTYWLNLLLLIVFAWVANILRIIVISIAALTLGSQFASGLFHTWGGLLVIVLMFIISWLIFSIQQNKYQPIPSLNDATS